MLKCVLQIMRSQKPLFSLAGICKCYDERFEAALHCMWMKSADERTWLALREEKERAWHGNVFFRAFYTLMWVQPRFQKCRNDSSESLSELESSERISMIFSSRRGCRGGEEERSYRFNAFFFYI